MKQLRRKVAKTFFVFPIAALVWVTFSVAGREGAIIPAAEACEEVDPCEGYSVGSPENWDDTLCEPRDCLGVPGGDAQILACGCNDATSCLDCAGMPYGDAEDLGCGCNKPAPGVCGCSNEFDYGCGCGNPPPGECGCESCPPQQCEYVRGDIVVKGFSETKLQSYDKIFQKTGEAAGLACLDKMIERAIKRCQSNRITSRGNGIKHHDDCLAWEIASYVMPDWNGKKHKVGEHSNGAVCDKLHLADMRWCPSGSKWGFGIAKGCKPCAAGHFYLAEDPNNPDMCRVVQPDPEKEVCGTFSLNYYRSTPISLVWPGEGSGDAVTFSRFPLDPRRPEMWHVWRASAQMPLLVYNPAHDGKITSAAQLFGPWTFGGQRFAAMNTNTAPTPWNNGYEALATLDADGSGRVEGSELEPLALWFDKNQNGVAEPGEVRPLAQTGVTELAFGPVMPDGEGNLYVEAGYKQISDGKERWARSIDWATETAPTQFDLLSQYYAPVKEALSSPQAEVPAEPLPAEGKDTAQAPADYIGGVWQWAAAGDDPQRQRGYFVLNETPDGVAGYSMLETPFRRAGADELNAYGTMFLVTGKKTKDEQGRIRLSLSLAGGSPNVTSEAVLAADLQTMEGRSIVQPSQLGKLKGLRYSWTATRRQ